jgi:ABC-type multidrug transport system fused ATPase/permease subunit
VPQVSFTYPNATDPVLRNVSFNVAPGTTVALVGPSGSGKSTALKLLTRLFEPTQGAVKVDGVDTR